MQDCYIITKLQKSCCLIYDKGGLLVISVSIVSLECCYLLRFFVCVCLKDCWCVALLHYGIKM